MIDTAAFSTDVLAQTTEIVTTQVVPFDWNNVLVAANTFFTLSMMLLAWWKANKVEAKIADTHTDVIANKAETAELKVHTNSITSELVKAREELAGLRAAEAVRVESAKNEAEQAKGARAAELKQVVEAVNGTHRDPAKVEVVNEAKPVPVKITKTEAGKIVAAAKQPRRKAKRK